MSATRFIHLPKSHPSPSEWLQLAERYKAFRLLSLRLSPESFGSTYAREVDFAPDRWTSRLSSPQGTRIIAVDGGSSPCDPLCVPAADFELVLNAEWLASLVINGPLDPATLASYLHLEESFLGLGSAKQSNDTRRHYVLNEMYVIPSARGKKLGVRILERAKRFVAAEAETAGQKARVSLTVDYENSPARLTYEGCGFEIVHRYWFDDYREGREARTEAAVMVIDLDGEMKI